MSHHTCLPRSPPTRPRDLFDHRCRACRDAYRCEPAPANREAFDRMVAAGLRPALYRVPAPARVVCGPDVAPDVAAKGEMRVLVYRLTNYWIDLHLWATSQKALDWWEGRTIQRECEEWERNEAVFRAWREALNNFTIRAEPCE